MAGSRRSEAGRLRKKACREMGAGWGEGYMAGVAPPSHLVYILPIPELSGERHIRFSHVQGRLQRRRTSLGVERWPVHRREEGGALYRPDPVDPVASASRRVLDEKRVDELEQPGRLPVGAVAGVRVAAVAVQDELAERIPGGRGTRMSSLVEIAGEERTSAPCVGDWPGGDTLSRADDLRDGGGGRPAALHFALRWVW